MASTLLTGMELNKSAELIEIGNEPEVDILVKSNTLKKIIHIPHSGQILRIEVQEEARLQATILHQEQMHCSILLRQGAEVEWNDLLLGSGNAQMEVILQEPGASFHHQQLFIGKENHHPVLKTNIIHEGSHTSSQLESRGILAGRAKGVCWGNIQVTSRAAGCVGTERMRILLLSPQASCDALPTLDVAHHDVQCSHGAALGRMDADLLFYLATRGIPEDAARLLILQGFLEPVLTKVPDELRLNVQQFLEGIHDYHASAN